jgi:hypothetical protein
VTAKPITDEISLDGLDLLTKFEWIDTRQKTSICPNSARKNVVITQRNRYFFADKLFKIDVHWVVWLVPVYSGDALIVA